MISSIYLICLLISIGSAVYLSYKRFKNTDRYLWTILLLLPIVILGYWLKSTVETSEAAMIAFCFIYLDSTVVPVVLMFSLANTIKLKVNSTLKLFVYAITAVHLFTIWMSRKTNLYYSSVTVEKTTLGSATKMVSGPLKPTHYIFLVGVFIAFLSMLILGYRRKGTVSRKGLFTYALVAILGLGIYGIELALDADFTYLPVLYALASFLIMLKYERVQSHDMLNLIGERQSKTGLRGFCAFDTNRLLLGYNKQFAGMLPDISRVGLDESVPAELKQLFDFVNAAMDGVDSSESYAHKISVDEKVFLLEASYFGVSRKGKQNGYLLEISDITDEQKKLDTIEKYNERLNLEVTQKTEHIVEIQNAVVLGLANMVENRDDNTGGHIKRTSDIIKILVDEIVAQNYLKVDIVMAKDIVRAAPMHDLGKISIDSDILCKPARLTNEEFAIMKTHAQKSGEIVEIILGGVEEQHFVEVAYNVARYHHERWDGKGYPEGLLGENIPLEARIMSVADVYDALVSKRCYKASMSFEEAYKIMNECMGSQFDPALWPVFVACREKLETYYKQNA